MSGTLVHNRGVHTTNEPEKLMRRSALYSLDWYGDEILKKSEKVTHVTCTYNWT